MILENLTPETATLTTDVNGQHTFNLGNIGKKDPVTFKFLAKNQIFKSLAKGCSACTQGDGKQVGADIEVTLTYHDPKHTGAFQKSVKITTATGQTKVRFTGIAS